MGRAGVMKAVQKTKEEIEMKKKREEELKRKKYGLKDDAHDFS
jgi:hypothetical protein